MDTIKQFLLYIWQIPQNLLGLLLVAIMRPEKHYTLDNGCIIYFANRMSGRISLGKYSIVGSYHYRRTLEEALKRDTVRHEVIGHTQQSRWLGPLYLIIIGLPSLCWVGIHRLKAVARKWEYWEFYTERWADKIAGVKRYKRKKVWTGGV